ncbi:other/FunK1 protein kinase [Coprinopsis cinerea okayama7|uniref:Other/FunK1 protein kinase n=1 Tax=Coprinopsis cinerea (strain Okayama-7 / 130 / ATCC MYA-4618 / FGSC 9003) TaxID=240176 RepID=A8NAV6_COPC7|nr:other/FunK1 protein kinase [Coprinopsis cinerea okayama7\|eukprot:XP_001831958.1 other/FunK1 protein kinase [Coprinopsis cinerea okayama7\
MNDEIPTCNFEEFFESHLPNSEIELDAVIGDLKKQKMLVSRGRSLHQTPTSSTHRPPFSQTFKTFKNLLRSNNPNRSRVVKALQSIGSAVRKALRKVENREGNNCAIRLEEDIESRAQACISSNSEGVSHPTDVVVPIMAIDSQDGYLSSDKTQSILLSRVAQIMNEDARRTFCFGVSLEGFDVTLWRFTRSLCIKSSPFNMVEHPDLLVRLLVAFFSSEMRQLGYDPLVTLLPDSNYVYEIPSRMEPLYYKTVSLICDSEPGYLSGRRMRIWEVEQVYSVANPVRVPGVPHRVLKDVVLDAAVRTEADIQEDLFADIAKLAVDESWSSRPLLKDFPQSDIDVLADTLQDGKFKKFFSRILAKNIGEADQVSDPSPSDDTPCPPKRRCFFVFEHICTPLNDIPTLGEAVDALRQVLVPLRLMFLAGWVHRDISPGNILVYRGEPGSPSVVKLSDLEHAKKYPDAEATDEDRITGTPYFIACEILLGRRLFPVDLPLDTPLPSYRFIPLVHNYQHDVESIFWILLWLVSMRINQNLPREFGQKYFQQRVDKGHAGLRNRVFTHSLFYHLELLEALPQTLLRSCKFFYCLNLLRRNLYEQYTARNRDATHNDLSSYSWIVGQGISNFFDGVEAFKSVWAEIELMVDSEPRKVLNTRQASGGPVPPQPRLSPHNQSHRAAPSNKRRAVDSGEERRVSKKARPNPAHAPAVVPRRSGPITRSMARNEGRITRSTTRRLQEEERQKQRRL